MVVNIGLAPALLNMISLALAPLNMICLALAAALAPPKFPGSSSLALMSILLACRKAAEVLCIGQAITLTSF